MRSACIGSSAGVAAHYLERVQGSGNTVYMHRKRCGTSRVLFWAKLAEREHGVRGLEAVRERLHAKLYLDKLLRLHLSAGATWCVVNGPPAPTTLL
jgi:hypothetical protein